MLSASSLISTRNLATFVASVIIVKMCANHLDENGARQSAVFDSEEDATFKLRQHELKVEEIERGLRLPDLPDKGFEELCTYWLTRRASRKRSGNHDV